MFRILLQNRNGFRPVGNFGKLAMEIVKGVAALEERLFEKFPGQLGDGERDDCGQKCDRSNSQIGDHGKRMQQKPVENRNTPA